MKYLFIICISFKLLLEVHCYSKIIVDARCFNNGAIFNLAGQKVDENYKGLVIKSGKKLIQK